MTDLKILAESPYPNIANAATSLIVTRFLRNENETYRDLMADFNSDDETAKRHAKQAIAFLHDWGLPMDLERSQRRLPEFEEGQNTPSSMGNLTILDEPIESPIVPTVQNPVAGWTNVPRERPSVDGNLEETPDMQRRRRREAMVMHDGSSELFDEGGIFHSAS